MYSRSPSTEKGNEALMGTYSFGDGDDSVYYNNGSNRIAKREAHDPESSFNVDFLEEDMSLGDSSAATKGLLSSLMNDSGRHTFDLMKEDSFTFSASPSSTYSSRFLGNSEGRFDQDKAADDTTASVNISNRNSYSANASGRLSTNGSLSQHLVEQTLEHTTLAMQQLYVSSQDDESHLSNRVQSPDMLGHSSHLSNAALSTSPVNPSSIGSMRRTPIPNSSSPYNMSDSISNSKTSMSSNSMSGGIPIKSSGSTQSGLNSTVASSPSGSVLSSSLSVSPMVVSSMSVNSSSMTNMSSSNVSNNSSIMVPDYRQGIANQGIASPQQAIASTTPQQVTMQQSMSQFIPDSLAVSSQPQQAQTQQSQPISNVQQMPNQHSQHGQSNQSNMTQAAQVNMSQAQASNQNQATHQQALAMAQAQSGYYMPPMFVDQNGQPVYYRVAPQQYQPELVYPDGTPADPMQIPYMQIPPHGYWPGTAIPTMDQTQQLNGQVYMSSPSGPQQIDPNMMRRMVAYPPQMAYATQNIMPTVQNPGSNNVSNVSSVNGRSMAAPGTNQQVMGPGSMFGVPPGHMAMPLPHQSHHVMPIQQRTVMNDPNLLSMDGFQHIMPNTMMPPGMVGQVGMRDEYGQIIPNLHTMPTAIPPDYRGDNPRNFNPNAGNPAYNHRNPYDENTSSQRGEGYHHHHRGDRNDRERSSGGNSNRNVNGNFSHHERNHRKGSTYSTHSTASNSSIGTSNLTEITSSSAPRDPVVDDFRNTFGKTRQWSLRDLSGHIVAFCQDQHGSRFIQQKLEVCSDPEKQLIFDEVYPAASTLMTDVFGNYVLQKLFEFGTNEQCDNLSSLLVGQCVSLSMQTYGCRVVQKALEYVTIPRLINLVKEFENPAILTNCVYDSNGNHVIQKCIEIISKAVHQATDNESRDFLNGRIQAIIDTFRNRIKELSTHPYGCRVIQRILEHCNNTQKGPVLEELRQCCYDLVQDSYGNYVIQFVMQHGWDADRAILIKEVHANLLEFSQHKYASNVVEKCLQYASKRDRDEMIWKIINATFDTNSPIDGKGNSALEMMVRDPYANYVVQKVIDVSDEKQRAAILRYVRENIVQLRRYTYGKHIILRLEKITNEKF